MPLAKTGTCEVFDYEKVNCICHNQKIRNHNTGKRNTSGDLVRPTYQNYTEQEDYARHQHYDPNSYERKYMQEFWPINGESVSNYLARTNLSSKQIIESSVHKHLYGGKKVWPCHTTSRYCPICILSQHVEMLRQMLVAHSEVQDISKLILKVEQIPQGNGVNITINS